MSTFGKRMVGGLLWLAALSLYGCVGPVTQWQCDAIGREALQALAANDVEALYSHVTPDEAAALIAYQPRLEDPHIRYVKDHYPAWSSLYHRWYELGPRGGDPNVPIRDYKLTFRHHPEQDIIRLEDIRRDDGQ